MMFMPTISTGISFDFLTRIKNSILKIYLPKIRDKGTLLNKKKAFALILNKNKHFHF